MQTRRSTRLKSFNYTGRHRYFVTYTTFGRARHFVDAGRVDLVVSQFLRASRESHVAISAYCFMPDHAHLLLEGTSGQANGRAFINRSKQYSGYAFQVAHKLRLWQRDCYEAIVNSELDARAVAKYIVANPVRAGLVERCRDYAFTGSMTLDRDHLAELLDAADRECAREHKRGTNQVPRS